MGQAVLGRRLRASEGVLELERLSRAAADLARV